MDEEAIVVDIVSEPVEPPCLHNTASIEVEANIRHGLTAKETEEALQGLYEKGLCTYPRTSSRYITSDMKDSVSALFAGGEGSESGGNNVFGDGGSPGGGGNEPRTDASCNATENSNTNGGWNPNDVVEVLLSKDKYPESAQHIMDAIKNGHPAVLTIDRKGASDNRKESLKGIPTIPGKDRDEYPPAMSREGGAGASVRYIDSKDNRGSGSAIGRQLRKHPDGTKYTIKIIYSDDGG